MPYNVINTIHYLTGEAKEHLAGNGCAVRFCELAGLTPDQFCAEIQGVDAVIAGGERWSEKVFQAADKIKIVARSGSGYDQVDLGAATRHGVWVTNTPDANSNAVADLTIGLILCLLRGIPAMLGDMKAGIWKQVRGKELGSLTLGIVGAGRIGRQVAQRARGFGARVLVCDVAPDEAFAASCQVEYAGLDRLFSISDIVSLHCALNEQTLGLVNRRLLGMMKREAYIVNTSRPAVIVRDDLVAALTSGRIAGAAIDVHDPRPSPDDPLVRLDNVLATPWVGSYTDAACAAMVMTAAEEIVRVLRGDVPRFPVNRIPALAHQ
jgi:D-3-phosphoglycerate dehydrogenase